MFSKQTRELRKDPIFNHKKDGNLSQIYFLKNIHPIGKRLRDLPPIQMQKSLQFFFPRKDSIKTKYRMLLLLKHYGKIVGGNFKPQNYVWHKFFFYQNQDMIRKKNKTSKMYCILSAWFRR